MSNISTGSFTSKEYTLPQRKRKRKLASDGAKPRSEAWEESPSHTSYKKQATSQWSRSEECRDHCGMEGYKIAWSRRKSMSNVRRDVNLGSISHRFTRSSGAIQITHKEQYALDDGRYRSPQQTPPGPLRSRSSLPPSPPLSPAADDPQLEVYSTDRQREKKLLQELEILAIRQEEVMRFRVSVQQKRVELRVHQDKVSDCYRAFMDMLRRDWSDGVYPRGGYLDKLYRDCQDARDALGPVEAQYNAVELQLGAQEYEVNKKISDMRVRYSFPSDIVGLHDDSILETQSSNIIFESHTSDMRVDLGAYPEDIAHEFTGDAQSDKSDASFNGRYGQNVLIGELPKFGIVDMAIHSVAEPNLQGLQSEVEKLSHSNALSERELSNINLSAPDLQFESLWNGWHLRASSNSAPAYISNDFGHEVGAQHQDGFDAVENGLDLMPDLQVRSMEECERSDDLHPRSEIGSLYLKGISADDKSVLRGYIANFSSAHERVNRWLLYNLRVSNWEVLKYSGQLRPRSPSSPSDWATSVLAMWDEDDAARAPQHDEDALENAQDDSASAQSSASASGNGHLHVSEHISSRMVQFRITAGSRPHSTAY